MNFVFISPNFPHTYWHFCDCLRRNGVNILGIGDSPYYELEEPLRNALVEYYKVNSLENFDEVKEAVRFFSEKYGKIDWLESNNEYWLEKDAWLRNDFNITTGVQGNTIEHWKRKSLMHETYVNAGIPKARQHKVSTIEAAKEFLNEIGGYPVIVKPDIGVGAYNTMKLKNDEELQNFYNEHIPVPYVMEEFVEGNICSYDAIVDSKGEPLFESSSIFPPSIADIVNEGYDLAYYTTTDIPEQLKNLGRKTIKAFNVKSRFVHFEFFCLTKDYEHIGKVGDFAALEVNMRPAGGYTPDMMNFANSTDVYQIWADMITTDKRCFPPSDKLYFCLFASRKYGYNYLHSHDEIWQKYGDRMMMCEEMPRIMWDTMGCQMYTINLSSKDEVFEAMKFIQTRV